jgi:hypothetical protein
MLPNEIAKSYNQRLMRFMPDFPVRHPAGGSAVQIGNPADLSYLSTSYDGSLCFRLTNH